MIELFVAASLAVSPQDFLEGAEIGNAVEYVALESHGKYHAERADKEKGKTVLKGTWAMKGENKLEVKVAACKGPACQALNKSYQADVAVVAERAMTVKSTPGDAMFASGSYYCHYQGCEKRTGIELLSKGAKAMAVHYALDFLIDKNRKRDVTVVWWGKKLQGDAGKTRIEYCTRELERGKTGAELVAGDLAELPWVGKLEAAPSAEKDCLWDVRVYLADDVAPPAKQRDAP